MTRFTYIAMKSSGERVAGALRSSGKREAISKLIELGYHPINVESERDGRHSILDALTWKLSRVRVSDLAVFTRQLAALLKAGMPMMSALETLRQQLANRHLVQIIEDLRVSLGQEAATFADALSEHPKVFSPVYCGLVRSGEESGRLVEVLNSLALHLTRTAKLRSQVSGAFIYPAFLLFMGVAAVFVLMSFVIPKFQKLFEAFDQELPWVTRVLIAVSGFLSQWWWAVLLLAAVGGLIVHTLLSRPSIRIWIDSSLLRLPVLGALIVKMECARISRTLAALLSGGIRIVQAIAITATTVGNRSIRASLGPIGESVSVGVELGTAMDRVGLFPPLLVNLVRTGEETGELPEMLEELASIYDDETERAVSAAVKLLEPILIILIGLVIAGIVAAVMLPIIQSSAIVS